MAYTPPANNAINFELQPYTAPSNTGINFELGGAGPFIPAKLIIHIHIDAVSVQTNYLLGASEIYVPSYVDSSALSQIYVLGVPDLSITPVFDPASISQHQSFPIGDVYIPMYFDQAIPGPGFAITGIYVPSFVGAPDSSQDYVFTDPVFMIVPEVESSEITQEQFFGFEIFDITPVTGLPFMLQRGGEELVRLSANVVRSVTFSPASSQSVRVKASSNQTVSLNTTLHEQGTS